MRINLNEFLTDEDIHTLWGIAGRIIDSGAIIEDQDYEISLSLIKSDDATTTQPLKKVSQSKVGKDMDLL
tara:strand:- start:356 stop:565 length:210 start_codon:yes stop_codon:yes gene_type:complete